MKSAPMLPSERPLHSADGKARDAATDASRPDGDLEKRTGGAATPVAMQQRIVALTEELREARRLDAAKTEFLAMVSHELRSPLNAVVGFSEAALHGVHGPLPESYRSYFAAINGVGRHLDALVGNLLDLAQIESGRFSIAPRRIAARPLVEEAGLLVAPLAERSGVDIAAVALEAELWLEADPVRTLQILVNLLANAVKFTPRDGKVGIAAAAQDRAVELTVWDTGIGIPREHQARVFEAFYQLSEKPLGNRGKGVGLGLAIARQLAQVMGGEIVLESVPGEGSQFTLRLPRSAE